MATTEQRRHVREDVALAAVVSPGMQEMVAAVIDLSEGGARLELSSRGKVAVGTPVQLCFLLSGGHVVDLRGRIARSNDQHVGVEFVDAERHVALQLLDHARGRE